MTFCFDARLFIKYQWKYFHYLGDLTRNLSHVYYTLLSSDFQIKLLLRNLLLHFSQMCVIATLEKLNHL